MADLFDLRAKISLDSSEYERGLDSASGKASSFAGKIGSGLASAAKVGAAAITAATAAVTAFAKSSVDVGMNFDKSMSQVAATMGTTVDQIQELRDFALQMGSSTQFSASQAADALNYMALAGYDAEQSMQALPNVLNLAAAGGIELARASDMITDAQSALGLTFEESAVLVDQMAQAASKSNTSVEQLGDAILTVGGTAKNLAGGTTELSTALGILADNGIKGSEGGTALRNIILALAAPTDQAAEKMEELGLAAYDADGNLRPLDDIFEDLNGALSDMTQGEQTEVLNTLFNKVDLKSANALLATSADRWAELSGAIDDASGSAQKMADTQLDNLAGDITIFQSALEGAKIAISDELTPSLRQFVQFGSDGLSRLTMAFQEGGLSGAMDAFGEILSEGLNMIIAELPSFVQAGMQLLESLGKGLIDNLPVIVDSAVEILMMLTTSLIENLPTLVEAALQIILQLAMGISEALPQLIPTIGDVIMQIVITLIDNVDMLIDAAIAIILALADGLIQALPRLIEKAPEIILKVFEALVENAPKLLEAALVLIETIVDGIGTYLSALWDAGKALVEGLWEGIKGAASWLWDQITGWIGGVVDGIKGFLGIHSPSTVFADIGENMADGLGVGFGDGMEGVQRDVPDAIRDGFEPMLAESQKLIDNMNLLWEQVGLGAYTAWEQIVFVWTEAIVWFDETVIIPLKEHWTEYYEYVSKLFSDLWEDVKSIWGIAAEWFLYEVINPIIENFEAIPEPISSAFQAAWEGVTSIWGGAAGWFEANVVQPILASIQNIATALDGALKDAENRMSNMSNSVNTGSGNVLNGVPQMATGGILRRGQVALLEGKGSEAVIPLDQNKRWISALSNDLMSNMQKSNKGFDGGTNEITINVYSREGQSVTDLAEEVNRRLWQSLNEREAVWA